jgi:hypothetical protein
VTVFEMYTTEEQCCCEFFYGENDSMQRIFIKKCFLFMVRSVCRVNRLHLGGKRFADDQAVETEEWKWLRQ